MKKVLLILPNNLGDVIMALPVLEALKIQDPSIHITFFVEEGFEGGLINSRYCDRIFLFPRKEIRDLIKSPQFKQGTGLLQELVTELKSEQFSQVINLCQHSYIPYIVSQFDSSQITGRQFLREGNSAVTDNWSQYLYVIPFARDFNMLHASDIYKRIAGANISVPGDALNVSAEEKEQITEYIRSENIDPAGHIAVLQPGAAYGAKRWIIEHFVELGRMLKSDGYSLFVTGAPAEADIASGIAQILDSNCIVSAGKLSFRETIALVSLSEICVTGDTALMHAASALKKRVFALFGPTNPVETGPYGEGNFVFSGQCTSRPCFCFDCKTRLCMKSISPETVFSCIKGVSIKDTSCDIFQTVIDEDGTYALQPVIQSTTSYFNQTGAALIRKCFEPQYVFKSDKEQLSVIKEQVIQFSSKIEDLEKFLSDFLLEHKTEHIRSFEESRLQMNENNGISAFLSALLNIRLNSVPLIDPFVSVAQSKEACRTTRLQIRSAISDI